MDFSGLNEIRGLKFMPVRANKMPIIKNWQQSTDVHNLSNCEAIGLVCGHLSGNIEVIDVDQKYSLDGRLFETYKNLVHSTDPTILSLLVVEKTKGGGFHLIYRCSKIAGNLKLANRHTTEEERKETYEKTYKSELLKSTPEDKSVKIATKASEGDTVRVLLETRGEGGYIMCAPSEGYDFIYGDFCSISEITPEQREVLFSCAMQLNEVFEEQSHTRIKHPTTNTGLSPFDDYNQRGDVIALLQEHGWKVVKSKGSKTHMLRPGQSTAQTSGNFDHDKNWFSVFTTSTDFEPMHAYLPYAVFATLECNKDFSLASKKLFELGYGERKEQKKEVEKQSTRQIPSRIEIASGDKNYFASPSDYDGYLQQVMDGTLQMGKTTGIPSLDNHFLFKHGNLVMINGIDNVGKALSLDTPIPTPSGWTTMGDIKVGDKVFNEGGDVVTVTFTTDVMLNKKCYDIEFCNGQKIKSCSEHKWLVKRFGINKKVMTTEQMYESGVLAHHKQKTISRFSIDLPKPIHGNKINLPIHPYVVGYWIGNGHHSNNIVFCHSKDSDEILFNIISFGWNKSYKKQKGNTTEIHILSNEKSFFSEIKKIGLFKNKHIPDSFLRMSLEQRVFFLNGLMDSDGYCSKSGAVEFCTIKKEIADPFMELLSSFGLRYSVSMKIPSISGKKMSYKAYYIGISCDSNSVPIFSLKRKQKYIKKESQRSKTLRIVSITPCDSVPVRCIQVTGDSHLFLCGKTMIPTHNTEGAWFLLLLSAMYHSWKIIVFSSENTIGAFVRRTMQLFLGMSLKDMTPEEFKFAKTFVEEHFKIIKAQEDLFNYKDILNLIKIARSEGHYDAALIDPYNSLKVDLSGFSKLNTHEYHYEALSEIKAYGQQTDFGFFITAHAVTAAIRMRDADRKYAIAPRKEDTEHGAKFPNKADDFITWHRITNHPTDWMISELHVRKIKDTETGGRVTPIDSPVKLQRYGAGYKYAEWLEGGQMGIDPVEEWHIEKRGFVSSKKIIAQSNGWLPYKDDNDNPISF